MAMNSIIDQICQPFGWVNNVEGNDFGIYTQSTDGRYFRLAIGNINELEPWQIRCMAMLTFWFLLTQGVQLAPIEITQETIEAMRSETFTKPVSQPKVEQTLVGAEAFLVDPSEIKSFVGATRIQHAPPATSPIAYTADGSLEIRAGASPRRVVDNRINWAGR